MKKYLLLFVLMLFAASGFTQNASILNRIDSKEDFDKRSHEIKDRLQHKIFVNEEQYRDGGVVSTTIFSEDFSKFTAGSEDAPDATRLDDPTTAEIDDAYFNTPGWVGLEVYQAGGCAFIDFSSEYDDTGMLITPLVNTSGNITIKCRVKSVSAEGDLICYNIINENSDALDLDYTYIPGKEWVDIEFPSSYGEENSYVILFAMYDAIFIDDIEIINHYIPAPTVLPETNVTNSGFTANWSPIDGVDDYYFYLYATHTAQIEETYSFVDYDFSDIVSDGTTSSPEVSESFSFEYGSWYIFMPVFINRAIGISGMYSNEEYYGYLTSPEYNLSANNGTFEISCALKGSTGDEVEINLYNSNGDIADSKAFALGDNNWGDYTFTMRGGDEYSMIEIVYYGRDNLFIDNLKVYQDLATGDKVTNPIIQRLSSSTSFDVNIQEYYRADELYYQLYSVKYIYSYDSEYGEYYVSNAMYSDLTDPCYVTLSTENVKDIETQSPAYAYFNEGQLNIINPENEMVYVYNINGVCVYRDMTNGSVELGLAKGAYIVKIGNKVIKVVNN